MKERFLATLRKLLLIWGAVSLLAVIGLGAFIAFQLDFGNNDKIDTASNDDVRFILNWCGLGESRIDKVIHSYVSSRSLTGDHLDAYAIRISNVNVAELTTAGNPASRWYRGDQLPSIVNDAIEFAGAGLGYEVSWFPKEAELRSANIYVFPEAIHTQGITPTAVKLIFVRPSDKMIFYFSSKV